VKLHLIFIKIRLAFCSNCDLLSFIQISWVHTKMSYPSVYQYLRQTLITIILNIWSCNSIGMVETLHEFNNPKFNGKSGFSKNLILSIILTMCCPSYLPGVAHHTYHVLPIVLTMCCLSYLPCVAHRTYHVLPIILTICCPSYLPCVAHHTYHMLPIYYIHII
jgi:uncharacterized membrane protein YqaE (UPF0057 family)